MNTKILIIRFSSIGDILLSTPLIRILRNSYPEFQIDFLIRKDYCELIKHNPNVNNLIEFDITTGFTGLKKLARKIEEENYDAILDIHNSLRSRYIRLNSSAKNKYVINKNVIKRFLLVNFKLNFYKNPLHVMERYISTVSSLSIVNDNKGLEIFIPETAVSRINDRLNDLDLQKYSIVVGAAPSAKHFTKKWPHEKYIELFIKLAKDLNAFVINFGGKEDKHYIEEIVGSVNSTLERKASVSFAGAFSMLESAAAIDRCNLFITNDTGLMHLAAARNRKLAAIFGPTVREFGFFPYGTDSIVIENKQLDCRPCSHIGSSSCPKKHFKCMNDISVEEVFQNINKLLKI